MDFEEISTRGGKRLVREDFDLLVKTCKEIRPKTIVEIGSMDGCSSMMFGLLAKEINAKVYCIEHRPKARWKKNIKELGLELVTTLIVEESPWVTLSAIQMPIDFLFIDGNHRTRWMLVDYHYWERYVRKGGRIAFHDYNARKGVKEWVRRGIDIILEDDKNLKEVGRNNTADRGTIVFEKL